MLAKERYYMQIVVSNFYALLKMRLGGTTQFTDVAAILITRFVMVWRQPSLVIRTLPESFKDMAWMRRRSFQTLTGL
jgi:hypothetical protein